MNRIITFLMSVTLIACSSNKQSGNPEHSITLETEGSVKMDQSNTSDPLAFNLKKWESGFLYKDRIMNFPKDSIASFTQRMWSSNLELNALPVIGLLHQQIENDSVLDEWEKTINEETGYLYSIQNRKGHIGITLIQMNDGWVYEIKYLSFTPKGQKIGEIVLAADGGDGGYYSVGGGKFINDSTYIYTFAETEHNSETDKAEIIEQYTRKIIIHSSGRITFRKISE